LKIATGLFVPMLLIGAINGRIIGVALHDIVFHPTEAHQIDPSIYAIIGSAAMMAGFSRITISLCVIIVELTESTQFLVPVMLAVLCAKWVADALGKSIYDKMIELKNFPYLENHIPLWTSLYKIKTVMSQNVKVFREVENLDTIIRVLQGTTHNGFPVVTINENGEFRKYTGLITRKQLMLILDRQLYGDSQNTLPGILPYQHYIPLMNKSTINFEKITLPPESSWKSIAVNVVPYMNRSQLVVQETFSFSEAYEIFKGRALRHLPVVDFKFNVIGMVTRKDFLQFHFQLHEDKH